LGDEENAWNGIRKNTDMGHKRARIGQPKNIERKYRNTKSRSLLVIVVMPTAKRR
jgi:hypothetical protein